MQCPRIGYGQRDNPGAARVEVLGEPLDRAALARRVASLEDDHDPLARILDPVLELDELDLEQSLGALVVLACWKPYSLAPRNRLFLTGYGSALQNSLAIFTC
jgi:hypothetical protein